MSRVPRVKLINPAGLAPAVGFAHVAASGGWVFLGGQIGCDPAGIVTDPEDLVAQFRLAVRNVATALAAAGSEPEDVVKLTYYVTDLEAYRAALKPLGAAYREVFGHHYPATSLVGVTGLFDPNAKIEIEAIARTDGDAHE
jgi:enamine deaminase RidA (YjgF/YER057c/UK114 family)